MRWYVSRDGVVATEPFHVAFNHQPLAEALALKITAIHNRTQINLGKAKTDAERERVECDGYAWVLVAMMEADFAKDAPAAEAYADSLGKDGK